MTRPPRLLDSSTNDAVRSLLGAGLHDAPDANALPKVAAALGLTTVAVSASSLVAAQLGGQAATTATAKAAAAATAKATALVGSAPAGASAVGFLGGNTALALGKTLLVSLLSAGTLSAGAVVVYESTNPTGASAARVERTDGASSRSEQHATRVRPKPVAAVEAAGAERSSAEAPALSEAHAAPKLASTKYGGSAARLEGGAAIVPSRAPLAVRAETAHGAVAPGANTEPQRTGVLAREVRQIDSARQALESRNADGALAALDTYERSKVVGVLDREALLLKIEALIQKQDLGGAKALARHYVERYPTDTHAPRLRALLGTIAPSVQAFPDE
ncbi:MAG TPA: hypothetical protein VFU02_10955 [Polyangiaceae bacterium]|nr:hypothetical protein [Polyangiaceae bacterium]